MHKSFRLPLLFMAILSLTGSAFAQSPSGAEYSKEIQVTPLLRTSTTSTGQPIEYPKTDKPQITTVLVEIPPGKETGWHIHKLPCVAYILSGTITVEVEGGKTFTYQAGQAIAETVNTPHNGKNNGTEPVKIIMTVIGEKDVPIAEKLNK
jgi:quercetin dioxygenase-like cupin family protein